MYGFWAWHIESKLDNRSRDILLPNSITVTKMQVVCKLTVCPPYWQRATHGETCPKANAKQSQFKATIHLHTGKAEGWDFAASFHKKTGKKCHKLEWEYYCTVINGVVATVASAVPTAVPAVSVSETLDKSFKFSWVCCTFWFPRCVYDWEFHSLVMLACSLPGKITGTCGAELWLPFLEEVTRKELLAICASGLPC